MRTATSWAGRGEAKAITAAGRLRHALPLCLVLTLIVGVGTALAQSLPANPPVVSAPPASPPPAVNVQPAPADAPAAPAPAAPAAASGEQATPADPAPIASPTPVVIERSPHLPHDLSPWGMFMAADIVVKGVMIGLAVASFSVWTVWLAKLMELLTARISLRRGLKALAEEPSLDSAASHLTRRTAVARGMVHLAQTEIDLSEDVLNGAGLKERVASRLAGLDAALVRRMRRGMSLLATVGAIGPFVGLFGTVWGIMNSFIGISKSQTTSLAVVAPGIAEALLATGIGLVAAIPAVILYNHLNRSIATYRALVRETGDEVQRLVSRDIDRRAVNRPPAALVRRG